MRNPSSDQLTWSVAKSRTQLPTDAMRWASMSWLSRSRSRASALDLPIASAISAVADFKRSTSTSSQIRSLVQSSKPIAPQMTPSTMIGTDRRDSVAVSSNRSRASPRVWLRVI
jgi:hypothetical protein